MNNNNYQNPYQQQQAYYNGAYQYNPGATMEWTQPLTQEDRNMLRSQAPEFDVLSIPKEEMVKSRCAHRDPVNKVLTVTDKGDGTYRCTQCGEEFNIVDITEDEAEKYVNTLIDMLQTTKMMYLDLPPATIEQYFQMIPFLKKLPKLYKLAHDTFERATGQSSVGQAYMSGNPWFTMGQAVSGVYNGMPGYVPPMNNYQNPYQYQQPQYGYQQAPAPAPYGANPFMQGQPVVPAQQNVPFNPTYTQQYGYQQNNQQAPVQQSAPQTQQNGDNKGAGQPTVTSNKQFDV